jgi:predicted transcriptional regulator of viral defense system
MRYLQFRQLFKDFTVFSIDEIRKEEPHFYRRRLSEWQKKGYIRKVIKGYYVFSDMPLDETLLFRIANRIYNPSYVSFESALSYYGLIPEGVYGVTSAATRKTCHFKTPLGQFGYHTLNKALFFGYHLIGDARSCFKIAAIEKAVLDYFYIHRRLSTKDDFASLRFNKDVFFKKANKKKLDAFTKRFSQKILTERIQAFWRFLKSA